MKRLIGGIAAIALSAAAGAAGAATFSYSTDFGAGVGSEWAISADSNSGDAGILGQLSSNGAASATLTQTSVGASTSANNGLLTFDLLGFRTLDGFNCCTDTLNLIINGATVFTGTFAMGGGGGEGFSGPAGTTVTGSGQLRTITVPFTAVLGVNTFQFLYPNLQGFGDEAFGLDNVSFSAQVNEPVVGPGIPEPGAWALMILGFGGVGTMIRSRRRAIGLA